MDSSRNLIEGGQTSLPKVSGTHPVGGVKLLQDILVKKHNQNDLGVRPPRSAHKGQNIKEGLSPKGNQVSAVGGETTEGSLGTRI